MALSTSSARESRELTSVSNDVIFGGFGPRMVDREVRDCRLLVDGDIGVASGGSASSAISNQPITGDEVLNRYHSLGDDFLRGLKGGFRLCLWDHHKQRLIVAVDPFATKPVYYFEKNGTLAIAGKVSDLAHHPSFDREIDPNVVFFYLNHSFVPAPYSIYRGARRLQPGQYLIWQKKGLTVSQYWDIDYSEDFSLTEEAAATQLYAGVEQALQFSIAGHGQSSDRLGAFLSGGTDSSTLVGLLSKAQSSPVQTFSVGFTEQAYNEIAYARIAAKQFGAEAHEYFVSADDALNAMPILAASFDEPFGNSSAIPTYFCLRTAKEAGVTTMLAGDGGDELFGGNERYLSERLFLPYDRLPPQLQKLSVSFAKLLPSGVFPFSKARRYFERASEPNPDRFFYYQLFISHNARQFFNPEFLSRVDPEFALTPARSHYSRVSNAAALNRLLYMDLKMCIADNDLFKVNRMAESLDIKVCYPYLSRDLAELTGRIPAVLKLKGTKKRFIFKVAFRKLLPEQILQKTKHGFGLPIVGWLRNHSGFRDMARGALLARDSLAMRCFKHEALESLFAKNDQERGDLYASAIWNLMMLENWHRSSNSSDIR